jgi:predicted NBD/HSP70 family sugar kinase
MKFYTQTHKHYCGIDLHARTLYVCILDQEGNLLVHKNIKSNPEALLKLITPYRDDHMSWAASGSWPRSQ